MAAYLVVRVQVTDAEQYEKYKALTPDAVAAHGGRFVARGGETEVLEGPAEDRRVVLIEFPSMDNARAFYNSAAYTAARSVRAGAATMEILAISGD